MAKTYPILLQEAAGIRDEVRPDANSAPRVGEMMIDIIDRMMSLAISDIKGLQAALDAKASIAQLNKVIQQFNAALATKASKQDLIDFEEEIRTRQGEFESAINQLITVFKEEITQEITDFENKINQEMDTFKREISEAMVAFTDQITQQQSAFEDKITEQQTVFEDKITEQQSAFEDKITEQQTIFEDKITEQQSAFEDKITEQQTIFEDKITEQQSAFEDKITEQQTTFETAITEKQTTFENIVSEELEEIKKNASNDVFYLFAAMPTINRVEKFNKLFFNHTSGLMRIGSIIYGIDKQGNAAMGIIIDIEEDGVWLKTTSSVVADLITNPTFSFVVPSGNYIPITIERADECARTIVEYVATRDGISIGGTIDIILHDCKLIAIESKRVSDGDTENGLSVAPKLVANTIRIAADTASLSDMIFTYTLRNIISNRPDYNEPVLISAGQSLKISIPNSGISPRTIVEYVAIRRGVSIGGTIDIVNNLVIDKRVSDEDTENGLFIEPSLDGDAITVAADDSAPEDIVFIYSYQSLAQPVVNVPAGQSVLVPIDRAAISKRTIIEYAATRDGSNIGGTIEILYNKGTHTVFETKRVSNEDTDIGFSIEPALTGDSIVITADNSSGSDIEFIHTVTNLVVTANPDEQVVIPHGQSLSLSVPNSNMSARTIVEYTANRKGKIVEGTIDIVISNGIYSVIETKRKSDDDTNIGLIIEPALTGDAITVWADKSNNSDILFDCSSRNIEDSPNLPVLVAAGQSIAVPVENSDVSTHTVVEYAAKRNGKSIGGTIEIVKEAGTYNVFESKRVSDEEDTDFGFEIGDTLTGDAITLSEITAESDIEFVFFVAKQEP